MFSTDNGEKLMCQFLSVFTTNGNRFVAMELSTEMGSPESYLL